MLSKKQIGFNLIVFLAEFGTSPACIPLRLVRVFFFYVPRFVAVWLVLVDKVNRLAFVLRTNCWLILLSSCLRIIFSKLYKFLRRFHNTNSILIHDGSFQSCTNLKSLSWFHLSVITIMYILKQDFAQLLQLITNRIHAYLILLTLFILIDLTPGWDSENARFPSNLPKRTILGKSLILEHVCHTKMFYNCVLTIKFLWFSLLKRRSLVCVWVVPIKPWPRCHTPSVSNRY